MEINFLSNRKAWAKFGKWSLTILSLFLLGFFVINFVLPTFATNLESGNVILSTPATNAYVRGTITINVSSATDYINTTYFYYSNDSSDYYKYSIGLNNTPANLKERTISLNTATLKDGIYNITANSTNTTDLSYNVTKTNQNITVDNTAPTISLTYPSNNAYLKGSQVELNGTASETNKATIVTNNTNFTTNTGTYTGWKFVNISKMVDDVYAVMITANDSAGNTNSVIANFTVDNTAPVLASPTPANTSYISGSATQTFSIVITDVNTKNGTLLYKKSSDPEYTSTALTSCSGTNPTCTVNIDLSNTGTYPDGTVMQYYFRVYDSAENIRYYGGTTTPLTATIDRVVPQWTGNTTSPSSGIAYSPGTSYQFSITVTDSAAGVSNVFLEFNGANYTATNVSSAYSYTLTDLAASAAGYTFKWYMNDSASPSNWNTSDTYKYIIVNATPTLNLLMNGSAGDASVTYPSATNATGYETNSGDTDVIYSLYRNTSSTTLLIGSGSHVENNITMGAGTYYYVYNTSGGANYSTASLTRTLTINKGTLVLTIDAAQTVTYPTATTVTGAESNSGDKDVNYTLYRNNTGLVKVSTTNGSAPAGDTATLGAGGYLYIFNTTNDVFGNYTTNSTGVETTVTVTKGATSIVLYKNVTAWGVDATAEYPTPTNITAEINVSGLQASVVLERNSVVVANPHETSNTLGAFNYTGSFAGNVNYSASSTTRTLTIQDTTKPIIDFVSPTPANKTNQTSTSVTINVTHSDYFPSKLVLNWNGTNETYDWSGVFTNITKAGLTNGIYFYYVWVNDTSGNGNNTPTYAVTIDTENPTLSNPTPTNTSYILGSSAQTFSIVASDAYTGVKNGTVLHKKSSDSEYTSTALTSCSGANPTCAVNIDLSNTGTYPDGTVMQYYFRVYDYVENVRYYGGASTPLTATIDRAKPQWSNNVTSVPSGTAYAAGTSYRFNVSWTNGGSGISTVSIEHNFTGSAIPHNETVTTNDSSVYYKTFTDLAAGMYAWREYATDTAGNSNSTDQWYYTVAQATPTLSLIVTPTNSTTYPTQTTATGAVTTGDPAGAYNISLYRNGTIFASSVSASSITETILLGAGGYNYTLVYNGTQNYSSASVENITAVAKGTLGNYLDVALDSSFADSTITYNASINASGRFNSSGATDITFKLFRDHVDVPTENNVATVLGAGAYQYKYGSLAATPANWTAGNSSERALLINKAALIIGLTDIQSVTYPTQTSITAYESNTGDLDVNYTLYRNDTGLVNHSTTNGTAGQINTATLGAATYLYIFNTTGDTFANFTTNATGVSKQFTVSKGATAIWVTINGTPITTATFNRTQVVNTTVEVNVSGKTVGLAANITGWSDPSSATPLINLTALNTKGVYNFTGYFAGDANYSASSNTTYITVNDVVPPAWASNTTKLATGATYAFGANYGFQIDWTDDVAVDKVFFETNLNATLRNFTVPLSAGNTYVINFTDVSAGTYQYKWYANDTSNTWNTTDTLTYSVAQAAPTVRLWINDQEANKQLEQGSATLNFTATVNTAYAATIYLATNITGWGADKSSSTGTITNLTGSSGFTGNWFNITAYFAQDANYSAASQMYWLNVTPDVTGPTVRVYDYTNATIRKSGASLTLNISVSDSGVGLGSTSCAVSVGLAAAPSITYSGTSSSGWCNGTVTVPSGVGVTEGNNTINVTVSDSSGNVGYNSSYLLWVDNTAPTLSITAPTSGQYVSAGIVWINGTVYDNAAMGVSNVTTNNSAFAAYSFSGANNSAFKLTNSSALSDGAIAVNVTYNDYANNTGSSVISFYVDNTPPSSAVGLTNSSIGNKYAPTTSQAIQVLVVDNLQTNTSITLNYKLPLKDYWNTTTMTGAPGTTTVYSATIDTSELVQYQNVSYYITGVDNATNSIASSIGGSASSPLARITIEINTTGIIQGYVLQNGTLTVISGVTVSDGTRAAVSNSAGFYQIANVPAGTYTLTASAANYSTNSSAGTVTVTVGSINNANISLASSATGIIQGYVYLTNTTLRPNATVQVSDATRTANTNSAGFYQITGIPAGTYTLTVSGIGYWANTTASVAVAAGSTTTQNMWTTGAENFNVTIPGTVGSSTTGFYDSGWHQFFLSTQVFSGATTNYTIANLFTSVESKYTIIYRYNSTAGSWTSYVPGAGSNDLTSIGSTSDQYYINMNATDRVEIERRY